MSLAVPYIDKSRIVLTVDPRIDFNKDGVFAIGAAGERVTYRNVQTQNLSDSNISITEKQSMGVAIASKWFMNVEFTVTFSGTPANGEKLIQLGSNDAARFMPLTSITKTITVDLNDEKFTTGINDYHDALMRYNESEDAMGFDLSTCPSFLDTYQSYNDYLTYGSALNPLGNYGENSIQEPLRGGFEYYNIDNPTGDGTAKTGSVTFRTREPVLLSPLTWGHFNTKALVGIKSFAVNYDFDSNKSRVWSHNASNTVTGFAVTGVTVNTASLELIYITPKSTIPIMPVQRYPLANVYKTTKAISPDIPAGGSAVVSSDSMPLYGVPKRIYIFARRSNATRNFNKPDVFAGISKLNLYFNNSDGNFSQASDFQLYQVSRENGYRRSYQAFHKFEGAVMCVDFSKDMPLLPSEGVGSNENIQFQYDLKLTNLSNETITYTLFTIVIFEGLMTIRNGVIIREVNVVSPKDIVDSKIVQVLPHEREVDYYAVGGAFGSTARKLIDTGRDAVGAILDVGEKAYSYVPKGAIPKLAKEGLKYAITKQLKSSPGAAHAAKLALPVAYDMASKIFADFAPSAHDYIRELIGYGWSEDQIYQELIGRGYKRKKSAAGGKKMTQKELLKLLK